MNKEQDIVFIGHLIEEYSDAGMARNKAFSDKFNDMGAHIINPYSANLILRAWLFVKTVVTLFGVKKKSIVLLQGTFFILFPIAVLKWKFINKAVFKLLKRVSVRNSLTIEVNDLITLQAKDLELEIDTIFGKLEDQLYTISGCKYIFASSEMCKYATKRWSIIPANAHYIINGGTALDIVSDNNSEADFLKDIHEIKYVYAGSLNKGRQIEDMIEIFKSGDHGTLILMGIWGEWLLSENLGTHILYVGNFPEKGAHYIASQCDIGLCPYDEKRFYYNLCFPSKASFYITAGIPVLSTPLTELKNYMEGKESIVFKKKEEWFQYIIELNENKLRFLKNCALEMKEEMTWQNVMKKIETIL